MSGDTGTVGVSKISVLPTLEFSVVPALHSNNRENFSVTSALRMGSKSAALLQERAVCATVRMYSHWKRMKILKMNDWKPTFVGKKLK